MLKIKEGMLKRVIGLLLSLVLFSCDGRNALSSDVKDEIKKDLTTDLLNERIYEKANLIFIDSENDTWNMCQDSLRDAFED